MTPALVLDGATSAYNFQTSSAMEQSMPRGLTATSLDAPKSLGLSEKLALNPSDPIALAALAAAQRLIMGYGGVPLFNDVTPSSADLSESSNDADILDTWFPDDMLVPDQLEDMKPVIPQQQLGYASAATASARAGVAAARRGGRHAPIYEALRENAAGPMDPKLAKYLDRRKRNNAAAKKCRDAKKAKEDQIVSAMEQLRSENNRLRESVSQLEAELRRLRDVADSAPNK